MRGLRSTPTELRSDLYFTRHKTLVASKLSATGSEPGNAFRRSFGLVRKATLSLPIFSKQEITVLSATQIEDS